MTKNNKNDKIKRVAKSYSFYFGEYMKLKASELIFFKDESSLTELYRRLMSLDYRVSIENTIYTEPRISALAPVSLFSDHSRSNFHLDYFFGVKLKISNSFNEQSVFIPFGNYVYITKNGIITFSKDDIEENSETIKFMEIE